MRSGYLFLAGVATAQSSLDCSKALAYRSGVYNAGEDCYHEGHLWQANYYISSAPKLGDSAWTDLGACYNEPSTPVCSEVGSLWAAALDYSTPTVVVYEGGFFRNKWHSQAGVTPDSDAANWDRLGDCTGSAPTPTAAPTAAPTAGPTAAPTTAPGGAPAPAPERPLVGPGGECIWPYIPGSYPVTGSLVGVGNTVYQNKWWTAATEVPGASEGWEAVAECSGGAPKHFYTDDEQRALLDPTDSGIQVVLDPETAIVPDAAQALAAEEVAREREPKLDRIREAARVLPLAEIELITPLSAENPENVRRVESILSEAEFDRLFPVRHAAYTYHNFLKGIGAFPDYCRSYADGRDSDELCRRMLAISFAHHVQEVGANSEPFSIAAAELLDVQNNVPGQHTNPGALAHYSKDEVLPKFKQALYYVRELGHSEDASDLSYRQCDLSPANLHWALNYQCADGKGYFGRGAKQLSYNFNYGPFSKALYGDERVLLENPHLVADTWLNFASGIWFFVTPQSPKPAMTWVVDGTWVPNESDKKVGLAPGFGATVLVINGGVECGYPAGAQVSNRIYAYKNFAAELGLTVDADEVLDCAGTASFPEDSAARTITFWDQQGPGRCQIVSWPTPFSLSTPGDYQRCVNYYTRSHHWKNGEKIADYGAAPAPIQG